ncbi:MAG TPA: hypothetical protein VLE74_01270 [Candidatus Saccharimonadales bacterium]|nr:hypothetical protein [Candidatus Saccharimonadales bacterium]
MAERDDPRPVAAALTELVAVAELNADRVERVAREVVRAFDSLNDEGWTGLAEAAPQLTILGRVLGREQTLKRQDESSEHVWEDGFLTGFLTSDLIDIESIPVPDIDSLPPEAWGTLLTILFQFVATEADDATPPLTEIAEEFRETIGGLGVLAVESAGLESKSDAWAAGVMDGIRTMLAYMGPRTAEPSE